MKHRLVYTTLVIGLFLIEIAIAVGVIGGSFVRGSVGDILVISLIYFLLRAAFRPTPLAAGCAAVSTGFFVEALQSIRIAEWMGLKPGSVLYTLIGNTYSSSDLLMYVIGGILALAADQYLLIPLLDSYQPRPQP